MCILTSTEQHCHTHLALHITLPSVQPKTAFIYFGSHTSLRTQIEFLSPKILLVLVLHTTIKMPLPPCHFQQLFSQGRTPPCPCPLPPHTHLSLLEPLHCYNTAFGLCCVMVSLPLLALCLSSGNVTQTLWGFIQNTDKSPDMWALERALCHPDGNWCGTKVLKSNIPGLNDGSATYCVTLDQLAKL